MADILIRNARSHNLQGVSCRIPLRRLTVVTGVSGSGKTTLAFDTLYAEGQRRYVTSLSTYARQFLERLPRPEVDFVSNLPPAIAIERRNRVTSARSTVGTATEIQDHLRLLYARIGETRCPDCDEPAQPGDVESVGGRILDRFGENRISLAAPLGRRKGERPADLKQRLVREGFQRLLDPGGRVIDASEISLSELSALRGTALLLIDRLALRRGEGRARLHEAIATAYLRGDGQCIVLDARGRRSVFLEGFACDDCGRTFEEPQPALFSFNSPLGACPTCQGFGRVPGLDRERLVPDPSRSLADLAIAPFSTRSGLRSQRKLLRACAEAGVPIDVPFESLTAEHREWVFQGGSDGWRGVQGFFDRLERKIYRVQNRVQIARYRRFDPCPDCGGARLSEAARCVHVGGLDLGALSRLTLGQLRDWIDALELDPSQRERADRLLADMRKRVDTAVRVGLDYMTLDRPMRTLAGGEAQRIQLATALGGNLTASLYVLDEPSIGLHARDSERMVRILEEVRDQGNTVVVVEHSPEIVRRADHVIDIGPRAGRNGGSLVVEGDVATIRDHPESLTGRALRGELRSHGRRPRPARGALRIEGARENNLRDVTVEIPLGQLVVVTGVSGAGKSSLVKSVLIGQLRREPERGDCDGVYGGEALSKVVWVDPAPPARSPRSNAATVTKAFDGIRRQFAETREARARGMGPGRFSFNVRGGRCEACEGSGEVVVDMQFLDDVRMRCEVCDGSRYGPEVQEVRLRGLSIVDVLGLGVDAAIEHFAADARITDRLQPLVRVGLDYLSLGQPLSTLSGGETQRLRLARALAEGADGTLFAMDEPTTGLHPADIEVLLSCFDELLDAGASVVVIEHNLDVIRRADHIVDLGPEAGPGGGQIVATGPPDAIASHPDSLTGAALRAI